MQHLDRDEVTMHMAATPDAIYEIVSDVTRTPEYSPEILRCTWLDGVAGPEVGARFVAVNKVPNRPSWKNKPVVTVVEPGRKFAFARTEKFGGTVEWTYALEPDDGGTKVTEAYRVTKQISPVGWFIIGVLFNRRDRKADLHTGMQQSLARLAAVAERAATAAPGAEDA
jgi:hypothetical protein